MSTTVEIYVRDKGGAYTTSQHRGHTASSTCSALSAALRLGQKLFGPSFQRAAEVCEGNIFTTRWLLHADDTWYASCAADGTLHYGEVVPVLNTRVAEGPQRALRLVVGNMARMTGGQDADDAAPPRVPGLRASDDRATRDAALLAWLAECRAASTPRDSLGVTWDSQIKRAVP